MMKTMVGRRKESQKPTYCKRKLGVSRRELSQFVGAETHLLGVDCVFDRVRSSSARPSPNGINSIALTHADLTNERSNVDEQVWEK
jgi:hypothetical protein